MQDELVETLSRICRPGDRMFVLPVYYAGGTADKRVDSESFVASLRSRNVPAEYVKDYDVCSDRVCEIAGKGDIVLVMGARDPCLPLLAGRIALRLG